MFTLVWSQTPVMSKSSRFLSHAIFYIFLFFSLNHIGIKSSLFVSTQDFDIAYQHTHLQHVSGGDKLKENITSRKILPEILIYSSMEIIMFHFVSSVVILGNSALIVHYWQILTWWFLWPVHHYFSSLITTFLTVVSPYWLFDTRIAYKPGFCLGLNGWFLGLATSYLNQLALEAIYSYYNKKKNAGQATPTWDKHPHETRFVS